MAPVGTPGSGETAASDEAALRACLYQLDCAVAEARRDPGRGDFFALAAERDEVAARLRALDPPEASLGDQHNPDHVRGEPGIQPPIPSPSESGGGAAFSS